MYLLRNRFQLIKIKEYVGHLRNLNIYTCSKISGRRKICQVPLVKKLTIAMILKVSTVKLTHVVHRHVFQDFQKKNRHLFTYLILKYPNISSLRQRFNCTQCNTGAIGRFEICFFFFILAITCNDTCTLWSYATLFHLLIYI